jgi:type I restriction enzyme, S subunit
MYGVKMPRLGTEDAVRSIHALPPLPEQHRIVAKIDQLMARCDELEKLRAEREQKRLAVHTAVIKQLLDAQEQDSFINPWQFITRHFGDLCTVKENVAELRKAILQLAVMGKLVPQDPDDPPARELLNEIEKKKQHLVKEGKIKNPKSLPEIKPEEVPHEIPEGWQWVRLSMLAESIDYGTSQKTCDDSSLIPVFRMGNILDGKLVNDGFKYIAPNIDDLPRLYLKENDILFNRTNSYELVGKSAIYDGLDEYATFASYLIRVRLFKKHSLPIFFNLAMNAIYFRSTQIEPAIVQQCGQANFNGTKLSLMFVSSAPSLRTRAYRRQS